MDSTSDTETELLKLKDPTFSLIQYDEKYIDQDGNVLNNEIENDQEMNNGLNKKEEAELRQILNSLLPPQKITNDEYKQVSLCKPSRSDVISLQKMWDEQLQIRQARETGICAIREELNEEALNEIIRQITISLPERGLLSLRIRDEAKMSIETYQILYQSSLAFGMRKCLSAQSEAVTLNEEIGELKEKRDKLKQKLRELQIEKQNHEKKYNEQNQIDQRNQNQEKEYLRHQQKALQNYLKTEFGK